MNVIIKSKKKGKRLKSVAARFEAAAKFLARVSVPIKKHVFKFDRHGNRIVPVKRVRMRKKKLVIGKTLRAITKIAVPRIDCPWIRRKYPDQIEGKIRRYRRSSGENKMKGKRIAFKTAH